MQDGVIQHTAKAAGFSLTELLISVSLLGIMAGLGGAYYQRSWEKEQLKAASQAAIEWLEDKRIRAIQQSKTCVITINDSAARFEPSSDGNGTYGACSKAPAELDDPLPSLDLRKTIPNLSQLKICSQDHDDSVIILSCNDNTISVQQTEIVFTPRGTVAEGGLIKLHAGDNIPNRCIMITQPLGLIRQGFEDAGACNYNTAF